MRILLCLLSCLLLTTACSTPGRRMSDIRHGMSPAEVQALIGFAPHSVTPSASEVIPGTQPVFAFYDKFWDIRKSDIDRTEVYQYYPIYSLLLDSELQVFYIKDQAVYAMIYRNPL